MTDAPIDEWRKARKKPVEIEFRGPYHNTETIETIEGDFEVDEEYIDKHGGYVIIRGVEGEEYPCGIDIFRETYEQVPPEETDFEFGGGVDDFDGWKEKAADPREVRDNG